MTEAEEKIFTDRIGYLADQERRAILDLNKYEVGTGRRLVHWQFINELGYRKGELQEILRQIKKIEPCTSTTT